MPKNKDPAVLFYTSDFLAGTMLLSYEQKGKYIDLLCLQHLNGRLSLEDMLKICGERDPKIFAKFEVDENGLYYNPRMEREAIKRREYSESRRKNKNAKKNISPSCDDTHNGTYVETYVGTYDNDMSLHMGNRNGNRNSNSKKVVKHKYGMYNNILLTADELEKLKAEYPDWSERIDRLSEYVASSGKAYKSHYATIRAWARREAKSETVGNAAKYNAFDTDAAFLEAVNRTYKGGEGDG